MRTDLIWVNSTRKKIHRHEKKRASRNEFFFFCLTVCLKRCWINNESISCFLLSVGFDAAFWLFILSSQIHSFLLSWIMCWEDSGKMKETLSLSLPISFIILCRFPFSLSCCTIGFLMSPYTVCLFPFPNLFLIYIPLSISFISIFFFYSIEFPHLIFIPFLTLSLFSLFSLSLSLIQCFPFSYISLTLYFPISAWCPLSLILCLHSLSIFYCSFIHLSHHPFPVFLSSAFLSSPLSLNLSQPLVLFQLFLCPSLFLPYLFSLTPFPHLSLSISAFISLSLTAPPCFLISFSHHLPLSIPLSQKTPASAQPL